MKKQKKKASYIDQLVAKKIWERRHLNNMMAVCVSYVLYKEYDFDKEKILEFNSKFKEITSEAVDNFDELCVAKMQRDLKDYCGITFLEADGKEMRF